MLYGTGQSDVLLASSVAVGSIRAVIEVQAEPRTPGARFCVGHRVTAGAPAVVIVVEVVGSLEWT